MKSYKPVPKKPKTGKPVTNAVKRVNQQALTKGKKSASTTRRNNMDY